MSYKAKRKLVNGIVYIVLALVIASIMVVTVMTFISARKPKNPTGSDRDGKTGERSGDDSGDDAKKPNDPIDDKDKGVSGGEDAVYYLPCEGKVMKEFSVDTPIWSATMCDYRAHTGIDISAPIGSGVFALTEGTVSEIVNDAFNGTCMTIDHGNGLCSVYMNLASDIPDGIEEGSSVSAGQLIGSVGDTALCEIADTDHLHFAIKSGDEWMDPLDFLDFKSVSAAEQETTIEND